MTAIEIDELAKHKKPIHGANIIERGLYEMLKDIYTAFDKQQIPTEGAKKAKQDAISEYNEFTRQKKLFLADADMRVRISPVISKANICGCEICKRIAAIYDGRG